MASNPYFIDPDKIQIGVDTVKETLDGAREKSQQKKPTVFKWSSLANAFKEAFIMADPGKVGTITGLLQAKKQKEEGIESTPDNNWYLRRFKRLEELSENEQIANEKDYIDIVEDYEKGIYKGFQSLEWSIGDLLTSGIDLGAHMIGKESSLNEDLTRTMEDNRIADPETLIGDGLEILAEYGLPSTAVFKIGARLKRMMGIRKFTNLSKQNAIKKAGGKISNIFLKAGTSGAAFSAIDFISTAPDIRTNTWGQEDTRGLQGKDLALANFRNRLRFGREGFLIGAGFPLLGKPLSLMFRYGLWKPLVAGYGRQGTALNKYSSVGKIGLKAVNAAVANPLMKYIFTKSALGEGLSWGARKTLQGTQYTTQQFLPKVYLSTVGGHGTKPFKMKLPDFAKWRTYSSSSDDPLKASLKKLDNVLGSVRSLGRMTPEEYELTEGAKSFIKGKQRKIDKIMKSLSTKATNLAKAFNRQYNTNTTSPASMDTYLDRVLTYLKYPTAKYFNLIPQEMQSMSRFLKDELFKLNKEFGKLLPKGELRDAVVSSVKPYIRQSFAIFTNPYYRPTQEVKQAGIKFFENLYSKDKTLREQWMKIVKESTDVKLPVREQIRIAAANQVERLLEIGRQDAKDPLAMLQYIAKKRLNMDDIVLKTGDELPTVIKNLLGQERNLKGSVLTTANQAIVNTTNTLKANGLAKMGLAEKWLFPTREAAEFTLGTKNVSQIQIDKFRPTSLGIKTSLEGAKRGEGLWGKAEFVDAFNGTKPVWGSSFTQNALWRNMLQLKVATQYGKTVLSPATQVRNVLSAAMFSLASGHIGGKASVTEALKMTLDDVFGAGRVINEETLINNIERKVRLGVLDENIVAAEMKAILQEIKAGGFKNNGKITSVQALIDKLGAAKLIKETGDTATRLYAGGDNLWKWYGHEYVKGQYKALFRNLDDVAKWYKEIPGIKFDPTDVFTGQKKTLSDAIEEAAAWTIKNTYPTYSKVPQVIKNIRRIPFFGNFVSFPAEMTRTSFNLVNIGMKEIASTNPILRQIGYRRLLGTYAVMGGASTGALKLASVLTGVTDEQLDAYKASFAATWNANSVLIPINKWEGGIGKAINFSYFSPYDVVTQPIESFLNNYEKNKKFDSGINPIENGTWSAVKATGEYLKPFIGESIFWEKMSDVLPNDMSGTGGITKTGKKVYSETDEIGEKYWKSIVHILGGVEPGVVSTGEKIYQGWKGELMSSGQKYDLSDELTALVSGIRIIPVNVPKSMNYKINSYQRMKRAVDDAEEFYKPTKILSGRTGPQILKEFKEIQAESFKVQQEMYFDIQNALKTGVDRNTIMNLLDERLSETEVDYLMRGEFKPFKYNEKQFENRIQAFRDAHPDMRFEIKDDDIFPRWALDQIMYDLDYKQLNEPWYKDQILLDMEKSAVDTEDKIKMAKLPKVFEKFLNAKKPLVPYNVPVNTTPVSQEVVQTAASNVNINPETGLTRIDDALLSREEKAMRLRQKGMTA